MRCEGDDSPSWHLYSGAVSKRPKFSLSDAHIARAHPIGLPKYPVKITGIFISDRKRDVCYRQRSVRQQIFSLTKALFDQQVLEGSAGLFFNKSAQSIDVFTLLRREFRQRSILILRVDVVEQMQHQSLLV